MPYPQLETLTDVNGTTYQICDAVARAALSGTLHREIVQTLPTQDIDVNTIYMVPKTIGTTVTDRYDEYMYINNTWECIGSSTVDLTNYYNKTQVDNLLSAKVNVSELSNYYTKTQADAEHAKLATKEELLAAQMQAVNNSLDISGTNLVQYPYADTPYSWSYSGTLTITDNGDGTVTVNGTPTEDSSFRIFFKNTSQYTINLLAGHTYILKGCPSGGSEDTYFVNLWGTSNNVHATDVGEGVSFTVPQTMEVAQINIIIKGNTITNNLVFGPIELYDVSTATSNKQDKLTAGDGIAISQQNVISAKVDNTTIGFNAQGQLEFIGSARESLIATLNGNANKTLNQLIAEVYDYIKDISLADLRNLKLVMKYTGSSFHYLFVWYVSEIQRQQSAISGAGSETYLFERWSCITTGNAKNTNYNNQICIIKPTNSSTVNVEWHRADYSSEYNTSTAKAVSVKYAEPGTNVSTDYTLYVYI